MFLMIFLYKQSIILKIIILIQKKEIGNKRQKKRTPPKMMKLKTNFNILLPILPAEVLGALKIDLKPLIAFEFFCQSQSFNLPPSKIKLFMQIQRFQQTSVQKKLSNFTLNFVLVNSKKYQNA